MGLIHDKLEENPIYEVRVEIEILTISSYTLNKDTKFHVLIQKNIANFKNHWKIRRRILK